MKYALIVAALLNTLTVEEVNAITIFTTRGEVAYVQKDESESDSSSSSSSDSDDEDTKAKPAKKALV